VGKRLQLWSHSTSVSLIRGEDGYGKEVNVEQMAMQASAVGHRDAATGC